MRQCLLILWLLPWYSLAQTLPNCAQMLRDGDVLMMRQEPPLEEALRNYLNALNCNPQLAGEVGPKIQKVFAAIKQQKEREQQAKQVAEERLIAIQKQGKEIQAKTLAIQANSRMAESRYYEAMQLADQSNSLMATGEMQALMVQAYETLQKTGSAQLLQTFKVKVGQVSKLFYDHGAGVLIATDQDAAKSVMYKPEEESIREIELPGITTAVIFSPDHQTFVVANHKNQVSLWNKRCQKLADLPLLFFNEQCRITFSPCSQYLLYLNGFSGKLWLANGLTLVDGSDTLRPIFTNEFFSGRSKNLGAQFYLEGGRTYLATYGLPDDKIHGWDLNRLLLGQRSKSVVSDTPQLLDPLTQNTLPSWNFRLLQAENATRKQLAWSRVINDKSVAGWIKRDHGILTYTFDQQNETLVTATEKGEINIWQFNWSLGFEKQFSNKCLAHFTPQSDRVAVLESPFYLHLLDTQGRSIFQQPVYHHRLSALLKGEIFNPQGDLILSHFGMVYMVRDREGKLRYAQQAPDYIHAAQFNHDGQYIVVSTAKGIYQTKMKGFQSEQIFQSDSSISAPLLVPGKNLLWCWDNQGLILCSIGATPGVVMRFSDKILGGTVSPGGLFFVATVTDSTNGLYTITGKRHILGQKFNSIDFSPDDQFFISAFKNEIVELHNRFEVIPKKLPAKSGFLFSPGSNYLLIDDEQAKKIELLNLRTGVVNKINPQGKLLSAAFSSDQQYFALAFENRVTELRKINGDLVSSIPEIGAVTFSSTAQYLLIRKNNDAQVYALDGTLLLNIKKNEISDFQFSPDDHWLLTSSFDGQVKLIPTALGIHQFLQHSSTMR